MKKFITIVISILVILLGGFGIYSIFFKQDKDVELKERVMSRDFKEAYTSRIKSSFFIFKNLIF